MSSLSDGGEGFADAERFIRALEREAVRHFTPMTSGRLAWHQWGRHPDPEAAPLILLPGGFGSWRHWARNVRSLAAHYPVYVVELPGLGDSDVLALEDAAEIASVVVAGIRSLFGPAAQVHLAGFSFGGIIAGHVAAQLGSAACSLAIIGSNGLGLTIEKLSMVKRERGMSPAAVRDAHRANLATLMIADPQRVDALAVLLQEQTTERARARSGTIPHSDTLARILPTVGCPVHGIWGDGDALAGRYLHERIALFEGLAQARFTVIEGAGHWVMYEHPEAFEVALLDGIANPAPMSA